MTVDALPHADHGARSTAGRCPGAAPVSMIERMTLILETFDAASPALTLVELCERTGLPRSTVHRILDQMIKLRWLTHAPGGYRLGSRTLELGGLAADHNEVREAVSPLLHDLAHRADMVGHLGVLDGRDVLYLDKVGRSAPTLPTRLGGRMPAHSTALGKAMLAAQERGVVAAAREPLPRLTPRTICDRIELNRELSRIRGRQGVAVDSEESFAGVTCVAVPVRARGAVVAALSLSARVGAELPAIDTARLAGLLVEVAKECGRSLRPQPTGRH
ncbi:IclR family transcriptional regulator [Nocardia harenae]|uniref:IclR family transcriptional regulator n=1 Tax=Nocardia harenae TaxID=358707 RepID=UPI00082BE1F5|nr:IclR family transcriptional regulator [Nocardia harenae]